MPNKHKPNKCYYRPNRLKPRYFTQKDAARVFCQAKHDSGATEAGFIEDCKCWELRVSDAGQECIEQRALLIDLLSFLAGYAAFAVIPGGAITKALASALRVAGKVIPALQRTRLMRLLNDLPRQNIELEHLLAKGKELLSRKAP